jgi:hypothetical protein
LAFLTAFLHLFHFFASPYHQKPTLVCSLRQPARGVSKYNPTNFKNSFLDRYGYVLFARCLFNPFISNTRSRKLPINEKLSRFATFGSFSLLYDPWLSNFSSSLPFPRVALVFRNLCRYAKLDEYAELEAIDTFENRNDTFENFYRYQVTIICKGFLNQPKEQAKKQR